MFGGAWDLVFVQVVHGT